MFWASLLVFATEAATSSADPIYTGISVLGGGGTVVGCGWLVRHLIATVIPQMLAQHANLMAEKDKAHAAALAVKDAETKALVEKITADSKQEMKEMWTVHRSDLSNLWGEVKGISEKMTNAINQLSTELRTVDRTMKTAQQGNQP